MSVCEWMVCVIIEFFVVIDRDFVGFLFEKIEGFYRILKLLGGILEIV